jgi:4-carboxymuconolactone decarboxylase
VSDAPVLAPDREALIRVSAALATRDPARIRHAFATAAADADPHAVDEVILQAHLFVGFPDALNALFLWREVSGTHAPRDVQEEAVEWERRGARVCAQVYGDNYRKLRHNVASLHPDLDRWMVVGGYGRVIGRKGVDLATRELCIAALLAVWGVPRQLLSHLRGALNVGAGVDEVERAVAIASEFLDPATSASVQALWNDVKRKRAGTSR